MKRILAFSNDEPSNVGVSFSRSFSHQWNLFSFERTKETNTKTQTFDPNIDSAIISAQKPKTAWDFLSMAADYRFAPQNNGHVIDIFVCGSNRKTIPSQPLQRNNAWIPRRFFMHDGEDKKTKWEGFCNFAPIIVRLISLCVLYVDCVAVVCFPCVIIYTLAHKRCTLDRCFVWFYCPSLAGHCSDGQQYSGANLMAINFQNNYRNQIHFTKQQFPMLDIWLKVNIFFLLFVCCWSL